MNEIKKNIHEMIDGIERQCVLEYLERFIFLFLKEWG